MASITYNASKAASSSQTPINYVLDKGVTINATSLSLLSSLYCKKRAFVLQHGVHMRSALVAILLPGHEGLRDPLTGRWREVVPHLHRGLAGDPHGRHAAGINRSGLAFFLACHGQKAFYLVFSLLLSRNVKNSAKVGLLATIYPS